MNTPRRKWICARTWFLVAPILVTSAFAASVVHAETWTNQSAKKHVLAEGRFVELKAAAAQRERARGLSTLPRSNPFIAFQHEQSFGFSAPNAVPTTSTLGGTAETFLSIGQTFDLSSRRTLFVDAGERRAAAAILSSKALRQDVMLSLEKLFFSALAGGQRRAVFDQWLKRLRDLAARTRAREKTGDVSRYALLRIEREIMLAAQQRDTAELVRIGLSAKLAAWLDDDDAVLKGTLRPGPPAAMSKKIRPLRALALDEEARALTLEHDAAAQWLWPMVTATAGGKTVFSHQGLSPQAAQPGLLFTLQVPLPVFERGRSRRTELASARRVVDAQAEMETHHVNTQIAGALAVWSRALVALKRHEEKALGRSESFLATARAAWLGGELSLLALLEAERTILDDDLVAIHFSAAARNAQLVHAALSHQTGAGPATTTHSPQEHSK